MLIGRHKEKELLREWLDSGRSEFIAVYGRRRVGKTFLIRKTVGNNFTFHYSGSYGSSRKDQLLNFGLAIRDSRPDATIPDSWIAAFDLLKSHILKSRHKNKIIFLDELPWIDTPRSGFIPALEHFWNDWASWRDDIKLIVCGSATSWIINKIIRNKGGLHNRITHSLPVRPFHLGECEEYFRTYGFGFTQRQVAECYMTMGGIPYYFSLMNRGDSLAQNIDNLFFRQDAPLKNEFEDLYRALYKNYALHIKIIKALASKGKGLTRRELISLTKTANNGELSDALEELELCGFIRAYLPYTNQGRSRRIPTDKTSRNTLYQLIDFYSLFYLRFKDKGQRAEGQFWASLSNTPKLNAWRGITFEMLCLCHIDKIKEALGISDVFTETCSWTGEYAGRKAQVDLIIDRADDTINLCEMKFTRGEFVIDRKYAASLQDKVDTFLNATGCRKNVLLTLITTEGVAPGPERHIVRREVRLSQLF